MGYVVAGALVVGMTLGLMGAGGSIMTVPVLTYLLGHDSKQAIAESLAIVGGIATIASVPYARARLISWRSVVYFGLPGMVGTFAGAWLSGFISGEVQLVLFAFVMLAAAFMMLRGAKGTARVAESRHEEKVAETVVSDSEHSAQASTRLLIVQGLFIGILPGLVGVGGGFMIVPALVLLAGLSMRLAVGTSLVVIALNSVTGFVKHFDLLQDRDLSMDWSVIALFIVVGTIASFAGKQLSGQISQQKLRQSFAYFLLVFGTFVLVKEGYGLWSEREVSRDRSSTVTQTAVINPIRVSNGTSIDNFRSDVATTSR